MGSQLPVLIALSLTALALAGCTESGDHDHDPVMMKFNKIQCQDYPWGAVDDEAVSNHYGVTAEDVSEVDDGSSYATVCDGPSSTWVIATVSGHLDEMEADGWVEGGVAAT